MVDNMNPTNQFHPYQPVTDIPNAERVTPGGLGRRFVAGVRRLLRMERVVDQDVRSFDSSLHAHGRLHGRHS